MSDVDTHDLVLPPVKLRWGGPRYRDDTVYVNSGRRNVRMLSKHAGLTESSRVLDVGCGPGRLLTGLLAEFGSVGAYFGVDVNRPVVDWAQENLADAERGIAFRHVDVPNERYNRKGRETSRVLPIGEESFDTIVLLSVFSHMWLRDIEAYCQEFTRLLAPEGRVFLTAFTEYGVPLEQENPPDYHREWSGPLHCVRLNRPHFEEIIYRSGLVIHKFDYRHTNDGQSSFVLGRGDDPAFHARIVKG